ncbi:unnamed protein product [marine sediment metagenome]|uniref:Uncharacterized protein n=1 Tax=marine sediment metagenome TaxID=412755 RepID=X1GAD2_9ZZZZ
MKLGGLENLYNEYSEWQAQRQQQAITQFGEKLGLDVSMVEQMQRVYPEEELAPRLQTAGYLMTLLKHQPSASLMKQFTDLMFPEAEEEPTMGERMGDIEQYYGMIGEEGEVPLEAMPLDISERFDPQVGSMIQDVIDAYQELGEFPPDLLNAIISEFAESYGITMSNEEAQRRINQILQERLGVTVDFGLGGEGGETTPTTPETQPEKTTLLKRILGIGD